MAGDQRSAHKAAKKAAKLQKSSSYTPGFMKDLEQFMEAGYTSYDSEASETDYSKKERLI